MQIPQALTEHEHEEGSGSGLEWSKNWHTFLHASQGARTYDMPMKTTRQHPGSTAKRVLQHIRRRGRGSVFVPTDFLDIDSASREAVDAALGRLANDGTVRRIGRGIYDYPKQHPRFGPRMPSPDTVAAAVARSTGETVVVSDAQAANLLGLSTQVPAQAVYLTNGTNRTLTVNLGDGRGYSIRFKRVAPSRMLGVDSKAGLVLRALHFLGPNGVSDAVIRRLSATLDEDDYQRLRGLRSKARGWMRGIIDNIMRTTSNGTTTTAEDPVASI